MSVPESERKPMARSFPSLRSLRRPPFEDLVRPISDVSAQGCLAPCQFALSRCSGNLFFYFLLRSEFQGTTPLCVKPNFFLISYSYILSTQDSNRIGPEQIETLSRFVKLSKILFLFMKLQISCCDLYTNTSTI